jgi:Flp pilus assembly protein TadG
MIVETIRGGRALKAGRSRGRRRAAVAVELALSVSLVIVPMLLGIWEMGCVLDANQTVVEACREGGRQAATGLLTNAQVQQVVLQYLSNVGVSTTGVTVTVVNTGTGTDASLATQNDPLVVTVSLPFKNVDWSLTQKYVSDSSSLTTTCTWNSNKDFAYSVSTIAPTQ